MNPCALPKFCTLSKPLCCTGLKRALLPPASSVAAAFVESTWSHGAGPALLLLEMY